MFTALNLVPASSTRGCASINAQHKPTRKVRSVYHAPQSAPFALVLQLISAKRAMMVIFLTIPPAFPLALQPKLTEI